MLDEADKLLDMDFEQEIDQVLKVIPRERRTQLFSATMTSKVQKLQRACLVSPVKVEVASKYSTGKCSSGSVNAAARSSFPGQRGSVSQTSCPIAAVPPHAYLSRPMLARALTHAHNLSFLLLHMLARMRTLIQSQLPSQDWKTQLSIVRLMRLITSLPCPPCSAFPLNHVHSTHGVMSSLPTEPERVMSV